MKLTGAMMLLHHFRHTAHVSLSLGPRSPLITAHITTHVDNLTPAPHHILISSTKMGPNPSLASWYLDRSTHLLSPES